MNITGNNSDRAETVTRKSIPREHIHCALCGADDPRILFSVRSQDMTLTSIWLDGIELQMDETETIVVCWRCGLGYVNPRLADHPGLVPFSVTEDIAYFKSTHDRRLAAYRSLLDRVPAWVGRQAESLLDIGCGDGTLLEAAGQAGIRQRLGLEVSDNLIHLVGERLGDGLVSAQPVEALPTALFDVVALINVLEHLRQPLEMLKHAQARLKPGGVLLVHVPNFGGLPARLRGPRWHQIEPYAHFYYFTPDVLGTMLKHAGLSPFARFHLATGGALRRAVQRLSASLGMELDNGLGIVARRPLLGPESG